MNGLINVMLDEMERVQKRFLYEQNELLGFPKPNKIVFFTNGLKDQDPVKWEKTEFGFKAMIKTLGVEKAKVEIENDGLKISGKNIIEDKDFGTDMPLPVISNILGKIVEIKHKTVAGVTFVELYLDKPEKKIKISEMK